MKAMVTYAHLNSEAYIKPSTRARGQDRRRIPTASPRLNSPARTNLHHSAYKSRARLGSCSRDPIGYEGGNSMYSGYFVLSEVDPEGLFSCTPGRIPGADEPCVDNGGLPIGCTKRLRKRALAMCHQDCFDQGLYYQGGGLLCCRQAPGGGSVFSCRCRSSNGCDKLYLYGLLNCKDFYCNRGGCDDFDCNQEVHCKLARLRIEWIGLCIRYRDRIQACFSPGDPGYEGHMIQIQQQKIMKRKCIAFYIKCKNEGPLSW